MTRAAALRRVAAVLAVAGTAGPAAVAVTLVRDAPVHAAAWGALAILLGAGFGMQAAQPSASTAGVQQVAAVGLAGAGAGALALDRLFGVLPVALALAVALLLVLHPRGGVAVTVPDTPSLRMLALAAVAAVPFWAVAGIAARADDGLLGGNPGGAHWSALAAAAAAVPLVAAVAAVRAHGWPACAWSAAAAGALLALASLVFDDEPGSMARGSLTPGIGLDRSWPAVALAWAVVFAAFAEWRRRATRGV